MEIVQQDWQFEHDVNGEEILQRLEAAGRTCYRSEDKITSVSAREFCAKIIANGHHSVLEHCTIGVRIITDRGVTHEIVRHRIGVAYSQESTRYCRYDGSREGLTIKFIAPVDFELDRDDLALLQYIENHYNWCLRSGRTPQQARYFLPNGLKTEIVCTLNIRSWRHFFTLRCSPKAHPQMRALALSLLHGFAQVVPYLFDDLAEKYLHKDASVLRQGEE